MTARERKLEKALTNLLKMVWFLFPEQRSRETSGLTKVLKMAEQALHGSSNKDR